MRKISHIVYYTHNPPLDEMKKPTHWRGLDLSILDSIDPVPQWRRGTTRKRK